MTILKKLSDISKGKAVLTDKRSSKWPKIRKEHLKKFPYCACCGETKNLEVHHMVPFNVNPDLELDPSNLITLCENSSFGITCHLLIGHMGNYKKANENIMEDIEYIKNNILNKS